MKCLNISVCPSVYRLQVFLNTYGIQTQTPQQVEPIQIWPQKELVKVTNIHAIANNNQYIMELVHKISEKYR